MLPRTDDEWRLALLASTENDPAWTQDSSERDIVWVGKTETLRNLLQPRTTEAQGHEMAAFVDAAFSTIPSVRPDAPGSINPA